MPVDAERDGDWFYVRFDLPGVDPDSIDLTVERTCCRSRRSGSGHTRTASRR
jgi:HSP20 family protein